MKISLLLTAVILALAGLFNWSTSGKIASAQAERERLTAQAIASGYGSVDEAPAERTRRRDRQNAQRREERVKACMASLDSHITATQIAWNAGKPADAQVQREEIALIEQLEKLDAAQLKSFFAQADAAGSLEHEACINMLVCLADDRPAEFLAACAGSSESVLEILGRQGLEIALKRQLESDPAAAPGWIRETLKAHPELLGRSKEAIVGWIAPHDPQSAFQLLRELGASSSWGAVDIARSATTPDQAAAVLTAMRQSLGSFTDEVDHYHVQAGTLHALGEVVIGQGFDSATQWMKSANLSAEEAEVFQRQLCYDNTGKDTGKWIDWMETNLPGDKAPDSISKLTAQWAEDDYKAAGEWINASPAGPARLSAVRGYAGVLAKHEPEAAARWALTLPADDSRQQLLLTIRNEWQKKDAPAATAFAQQQGIAETP